MRKLTAPALICSAILMSCNMNNTKQDSIQKKDILAMNVDSTVKPGDDFFLFANGGWIKRTPIPESESSWGLAYMVQDEIYTKLKKINDDAAAKAGDKGSISEKIGNFWKSGMDSVAINKAGLSPLNENMKMIDSMTRNAGIITVAAALQKKGVGSLFAEGVGQDDKISDKMAVFLSQGGLGMPNREYYFNTDERTAKIRETYKAYLLKTLEQLNPDTLSAKKNSDAVFALESRLAKVSRKLADTRDPYKNYNKMDWAGLSKIAPSVNWSAYTAATGYNKVDTVIIGQPEFFTALSNEVKNTPIEVWKNYLKMRLVASSAPYLDSITFKNNFEYRKALTGASVPKARWKRVLDSEEKAMGEALGQIFVKEYFSETAKKRYNDMVEIIRAAYKERIAKLDWMSDSTKQRAYVKLAAIQKKVGYPDKWKDFSSLNIDNGPWVLNVERGAEWWHNYKVDKLGKPVDRTEWQMTPQTYNAYYSSSNNEIVLPAGIFSVPGYKDEELDDALVYGYAAASTIGHEITHGFDDQGRQYDEKGNLHDWWTKADGEAFSKRAKMIIKQFNEFMPVDTLHINGDATQGENIADLGGILLGIDAFKKTDAYKKNEKIAGYTQMQRFFMGYALGWLYNTRKEQLASLVLTDVHSPEKERVNGPFVNVPEFYEAFNIKPGDKMYRPDSLRVHIW